MLHLINKVQIRLTHENVLFCLFFAHYLVLTEKRVLTLFFYHFFLFSQVMYTISYLVSGHPRQLKKVSFGRIVLLCESCEWTLEKNWVEVLTGKC